MFMLILNYQIIKLSLGKTKIREDIVIMFVQLKTIVLFKEGINIVNYPFGHLLNSA